MSEKSYYLAEFSSTNSEKTMSPAVEARELIECIAGPSALGGRIKEALYRVSRIAGLPERRVCGLWYGEARAIRAEELDALRRAASKRNDQQAMEMVGREELAQLRAQIARLDRLERLIAAAYPNLDCEQAPSVRGTYISPDGEVRPDRRAVAVHE